MIESKQTLHWDVANSLNVFVKSSLHLTLEDSVAGILLCLYTLVLDSNDFHASPFSWGLDSVVVSSKLLNQKYLPSRQGKGVEVNNNMPYKEQIRLNIYIIVRNQKGIGAEEIEQTQRRWSPWEKEKKQAKGTSSVCVSYLLFFPLRITQTIRAGSDLNAVEALVSDNLGNSKKWS